MHHDPYDIAVDQILEGADGDVRWALRTLLVQILKLEASLLLQEEKVAGVYKKAEALNSIPNPAGFQPDSRLGHFIRIKR